MTLSPRIPARPSGSRPVLIVIGASAGAIGALGEILPGLPADYPVPIVVVVHRPPAGDNVLARLFGSRCALRVREAEDKDPLEAGTVYFAPADYHLLVENGGSLSLCLGAEVRFSRPSIDVLFESAADAYGSAVVGVILTGSNQDGADGLAAVEAAGGVALVQRVAEAEMPAMPAAALAACRHARELNLAEIAAFLRALPVSA